MPTRLYESWRPQPGSDDARAGLVITTCGHFHADDHQVKDRIRTDHLLMHVVAGGGRFRVGTRAVRPQPGDLCWAPPGIAHAYHSDADGWEIYYCHFHGAVTESLLPLAGFRPDTVVRPVPAGHSLATGIADIVALIAGGTADNGLDAARALYAYLIAWSKASRREVVGASGIDPALHGDFASVAAMAAACGLSRAHFSRVFRRTIGCAPWTWVLQRRIRRAQGLLADPRRSIKQIAALVGFDDPDHFCRVFKRVSGITAGEYRRSL